MNVKIVAIIRFECQLIYMPKSGNIKCCAMVFITNPMIVLVIDSMSECFLLCIYSFLGYLVIRFV